MENSNMDKKPSYCKKISPIWWGKIKLWFGWGNWKQTVTSIVVALGTIYFLTVGGKPDLADEELSVRIAAIVVGLFWLIVVIIISYIRANKILYEKLTLTHHFELSFRRSAATEESLHI